MLRSTLILLSCITAYAQLSEKATWTAEAQNRYIVKANITYGLQNNFETKLDVYQRRDTTGAAHHHLHPRRRLDRRIERDFRLSVIPVL
jgi:hypothetical protein